VNFANAHPLDTSVVVPEFVTKRKVQIAVATSGFCNARCSSCVWPFMVGPRGVMDIDGFRTMLDNLEGYDFSEFAFNVINEPFTDRGVSEKLRELARRRVSINCLFFSSNWLLPSDEIVAEFVDALAECQACPTIRTISLNATISGIDEATYDVQQAGASLLNTVTPYRRLDFVRAVKNICQMLIGIHERDLAPTLIFNIKAYGDLFDDDAMQAFWRRAFSEHGVPEQVVTDCVRIVLNRDYITFARAAEEPTTPRARRCAGRWTSDKIVVGPNGEVGLCCQDGLRDIVTESLMTMDLTSVARSDGFQKQHKIATGMVQPDPSHPCLRCEFFVEES